MQQQSERCGCVDTDRRGAVRLIVAAGVAAAARARPARADDADPSTLPPQPGDVLVQAAIEHKGEPIRPADVTGGAKLLAAWAKDPASGSLRSYSRLYRILLLRLDPHSLDDATAQHAADGGIVAYSDFCTHAGCFIEDFRVQEGAIYCHCHGSMFDPKIGAKVVGGPARRPLAALPIRADRDRLVVAGPFVGPLGMPKA